MKSVRSFYTRKRWVVRYLSKLLTACTCCFICNAQNCPPNIDFETGTFEGWTCYIGSVAAVSGRNVITINPSGPVENRQTMYSYAVNGRQRDPYGGFPVLCPNGSGYSIRLGNNLAGTQAEGVSYQFTIPAGRNVYSLIYHYAVVFQDPNHRPEEQPRMEIEVANLTDNKVISCSSFTFIPYGSLLPGFFESPNPQGDTPVWCKDWSAVTVNLNGMAGKTIRLFFKTADCTFKKHFGYAYLDVNPDCSDEFVGAKFCRDDTAVNVTAPFGYQNYTWYNPTFTQVLGTTQTIRFSPPPRAGTDIAVEVVPYAGYGCLDTLFARLVDTLSITANAGHDTVSCNHSPVIIGTNASPGYVYSWTPTTGLSNADVSNPIASPDVTTSYVVSTRHDGGGCLNRDTVVVKASVIDNSIQLVGKPMYCLGSGDSAVLVVPATDSVQWFQDNLALNGANQNRLKVPRTGSYFAMLFNKDGCSSSTSTLNIMIDEARPGETYPVEYAIVDMPLSLQARQFGTSAVWNPGINLDDPSSYSPVFRGASDQLYTVRIRTIAGCETIDTQLVKTVSHADIYVPTAFTPNHDGRNDLLRPTLMGIKELRFFKVYNRWGQLLYDTRTERQGWDGTYNGAALPTQVIVWIAEGVGFDGRIYSRRGTSTVVR